MSSIKVKFSRNYYSKKNVNKIKGLGTFAMHQLVLTAILLLVMSSLAIIIFYLYFNDSIQLTKNYSPDSCIISNIEIKTISFNCLDLNGYVTVVELPCLKVLADSRLLSNLTFYRNTQEKSLALDSNTDCSYIPTACTNDPIFLKKYLEDNILDYFPPVSYKFDCFSTNDSVLLILPQVKAYYFSLVVLSFGIVTGVSMLLYAIILPIVSEKKPKYLRILDTEFKRKDTEFHLKRVLEQAHINVRDLKDKEIGIEIDDDIDTRSDSIGKFSKLSSLSSRYSYSSTKSNRRIQTDHHIIPLASKLKFGQSEIHIGRIAYPQRPSSVRLSRYGSTKTINSNLSLENDYNQYTTRFYLGDHCSLGNEHNIDSDLDIPDAILEEDERNLTIQKSIQTEKRPAVMQIFEMQSTSIHPEKNTDKLEESDTEKNKDNLKED